MTTLVQIAAVTALLVAPSLACAADITAADKKFLTKDAQGSAYELASAKLAVDKASGASVKDYAQKLVSDHDRVNAALEKLGQDKGLTLPTDMDASDRKRLAKLVSLTGAAFDKAYVKEAVRINTDDKRDADKERRRTKDDAVRSFLDQFSSMDAEHEKLAKNLEAAGK